MPTTRSGRWLDRAAEARFLVTTREVLGPARRGGAGAGAAGRRPTRRRLFSAARGLGQCTTISRALRSAAIPQLVRTARWAAAGHRAGGGARARDAAAHAAGAHGPALPAAGRQRRASRPAGHAARHLRLVVGSAVARPRRRRWRSCRCSRAASRWRRPRPCSICRRCDGAPWAVDVLQSLVDKSFVQAAGRRGASTCWAACRTTPPSIWRTAGPLPRQWRCGARAHGAPRHAAWFARSGRAAAAAAGADLANLVVPPAGARVLARRCRAGRGHAGGRLGGAERSAARSAWAPSWRGAAGRLTGRRRRRARMPGHGQALDAPAWSEAARSSTALALTLRGSRGRPCVRVEHAASGWATLSDQRSQMAQARTDHAAALALARRSKLPMPTVRRVDRPGHIQYRPRSAGRSQDAL